MASGGMRLNTNASTTASKPGHALRTAASGGKRSKNSSRNIYIYLSAVIAYSEYNLILIFTCQRLTSNMT